MLKSTLLAAAVAAGLAAPVSAQQAAAPAVTAIQCGAVVDTKAAKKLGAHTIGVRPEHIDLSTSAGAWRGTVGVAEHLGSDTFLHVNADGIGTLTARVGGDLPVRHGDQVYLTPQEGRIHRFDDKGLAIR